VKPIGVLIMSQIETSRVAEMLFLKMPLCDFSRTISDLNAVLTRISGIEPQLNWDYDDVASFDMPGTRILLSLSDSPYPGYAARLVISVGPSPIARQSGQGVMVYAALCTRLVNRLKERCEPQDIRWTEIAGIVTAEEVDLLADGFATPDLSPRRPGIFTPGASYPMPSAVELDALRAALHPKGLGRLFAAGLNRQAVQVAVTVALLPMTAVQLAALLIRTSGH
jgi:hypothetical protein